MLLDLHMPRVDGMSVVKTLLATVPEPRRPRLVALTADVTEEQRRECAKAGFDDYVGKPFTIDQLIAAIERCKPRPD